MAHSHALSVVPGKDPELQHAAPPVEEGADVGSIYPRDGHGGPK